MHATRTRTGKALTRGRRDYVAGLANGLRAIEAFSSNGHRMTVADVAKRTGLTRAATRRYLLTLTAAGYARSDGKHFQLTSRVLQLGRGYVSSTLLPQIAQSIVEELGHKTEESVALDVLEGFEILTIACFTPRRFLAVVGRVGTLLPALSSSAGRVLLAEKDDEVVKRALSSSPIEKLTPKTKTSPAEIWAEIRRIRQMGYAVNEDEIEVGITAMAVPVRNSAGVAVATVVLLTHSGRYEIDQLKDKFLHDLMQAGERLGRLI